MKSLHSHPMQSLAAKSRLSSSLSGSFHKARRPLMREGMAGQGRFGNKTSPARLRITKGFHHFYQRCDLPWVSAPHQGCGSIGPTPSTQGAQVCHPHDLLTLAADSGPRGPSPLGGLPHHPCRPP